MRRGIIDSVAEGKMDELERSAYWWQELLDCRAVWQHPGDHRAPHVVLRGGEHSDLYVDVLQALSKTKILLRAAAALAERIRDVIGNQPIDWVIGSPMAAVQFAGFTGVALGAENVGFTEKIGPDGKHLICRHNLPFNGFALQVEEMTTTGGTPQRSIDAIRKKNPDVAISPAVGSFLVRCAEHPEGLADGRRLVSVINLPLLAVADNKWPANECPLCRAGSPAVANPKLHWDDLLRTMENSTQLF